ncbi:MAG: photosynthetic complex assembly protein PuhC [Rubricella sp.]
MFSKGIYVQDHHGEAHAKEKIPKALVIGIATLCLSVLALVTVARLVGMEPSAMPPTGAVAAERYLILAGTETGGMIVTDAETGEIVADLDPTQAGFIGGVERALDHARGVNGDIPSETPVRLVRWDTGRLTLIDPESGWRMELIGFGETNYRAFAALMPPAQAAGD